ncbi:MAG TPA: JAB domain-containing protein [Allosphingosinicella sp.]|nr:JAB domain-containing protein [Allosphingosinicella sp.]
MLGDGDIAVAYLQVVRDAFLHALRRDAFSGPVIADSQALIDYLTFDLSRVSTERLRVLFLNNATRLLADEIMSEGSVSEAEVPLRKIFNRALELGATGIIMVHNHPGGDPRPSEDDIAATRRTAFVGSFLDIRLHDHLVIGSSGWSSLRALGFIAAGDGLP